MAGLNKYFRQLFGFAHSDKQTSRLLKKRRLQTEPLEDRCLLAVDFFSGSAPFLMPQEAVSGERSAVYGPQTLEDTIKNWDIGSNNRVPQQPQAEVSLPFVSIGVVLDGIADQNGEIINNTIILKFEIHDKNGNSSSFDQTTTLEFTYDISDDFTLSAVDEDMSTRIFSNTTPEAERRFSITFHPGTIAIEKTFVIDSFSSTSRNLFNVSIVDSPPVTGEQGYVIGNGTVEAEVFRFEMPEEQQLQQVTVNKVQDGILSRDGEVIQSMVFEFERIASPENPNAINEPLTIAYNETTFHCIDYILVSPDGTVRKETMQMTYLVGTPPLFLTFQPGETKIQVTIDSFRADTALSIYLNAFQADILARYIPSEEIVAYHPVYPGATGNVQIQRTSDTHKLTINVDVNNFPTESSDFPMIGPTFHLMEIVRQMQYALDIAKINCEIDLVFTPQENQLGFADTNPDNPGMEEFRAALAFDHTFSSDGKSVVLSSQTGQLSNTYFANLLLHEYLWHGMLDITADDGIEGTLGNPHVSNTKILDLGGYATAINSRFA